MKQLEIIVESQVNITLQPVRSDEETSTVAALTEAKKLARDKGLPCTIIWHSGRRNIITPPRKK